MLIREIFYTEPREVRANLLSKAKLEKWPGAADKK